MRLLLDVKKATINTKTYLLLVPNLLLLLLLRLVLLRLSLVLCTMQRVATIVSAAQKL